MKALKFIVLIFLVSLTAGCMDTWDLKEGLVADGMNKLLPEGTVPEEELEVKEADLVGSVESAESIVSQGIPEVPTYSEEKSGAVYPKEYRLLSLNFRRAIGSGEERTGEEVFNITGKTSGYNIEDACAVYNHVNRNWQYRYDKNAEFFFGASQTIDSGYIGDCDDYSIVMSALLKNMGFNTRVVTAYNESYGHAYPELYIGDDRDAAYGILDYIAERYPSAENVWYSERVLEDGQGTQYWLNFDWSGSNGYRHPGGVYFQGASIIYYPNGLVEF
ncbi:transglutaminase-like domain-containing protein [Methanosarcina sp. 2.H.A.1B.4]|uniref:transglutaminase-like domain-containing protein n=1 Tax=Methanosarcina sp. 2.H.A.1B.4 TaxID=1483600 RepID=UPI001F468D9E|nr:transglutaminase-like domain-containing protein [Methanosarcina sp. 2.H.A.1B.4]